MKKRRVVDVVKEIAEPICKENGVDLYDVEFVKEGQFRYLRVTIDKYDGDEAGVSIEDCQKVSRVLNMKLDEIDPIEEEYFLEVTSPGVERELKKDEDFKRFAGKEVQVKLYQTLEGKKVITGTLIGLEEDTIVVDREAEGIIKIPRSKVSIIKLIATFS